MRDRPRRDTPSTRPPDAPSPPGSAGQAGPRRRVVRAPAKINLNLLVGPKRADGFHPLDSLVAPISLHDRIELTARDDGRVVFRCEGIDCGPDESNLALRAAGLLADHPRAGGVDIVLWKRIEPGKGLGGGSSDAAAVLRELDALWSLDVPGQRLVELAAELGSDVPLFLAEGPVRMTGRGERIEPIAVHPGVVVLLLPEAFCATGAVYAAFDEDVLPSAAPTCAWHAAGGQLDLARLRDEPPSSWRGELVNHLGPAARRVSRALAEAWDQLAGALDVPVHLTGSGSGLFVLCDDAAEGRSIVDRLPPALADRLAGLFALGGAVESAWGDGEG